MHKLIISLLAALSLGTIADAAESLSAADKDFLAGYEKIQSALATDDLAAAKKAATDLGESGAALAKRDSLKEARSSFEALALFAAALAIAALGGAFFGAAARKLIRAKPHSPRAKPDRPRR